MDFRLTTLLLLLLLELLKLNFGWSLHSRAVSSILACGESRSSGGHIWISEIVWISRRISFNYREVVNTQKEFFGIDVFFRRFHVSSLHAQDVFRRGICKELARDQCAVIKLVVSKAIDQRLMLEIRDSLLNTTVPFVMVIAVDEKPS